jgi:ADP-heptose:LPS heptosyltransferase
MNAAVVVAGGLVETLQAAPLVAALGGGDGGGVLLAAPPAAGAVAGAIRGVDRVVSLRTLGGGAGLAAGAVALRRHRLDIALLCSTRPRDRLLVYAAGLARRLGPGGGRLASLLTTRIEDDSATNRSTVWLRMATTLGWHVAVDGPPLDPGEMARHRAETLLLGGGFEDGRPLVALAPGMTARVEPLDSTLLRWDSERFAHLANQLGRRHGAGVVILGDQADRRLIEGMLLDIAAPVLNLCGELTDLEMAAVAERCDLLVAADSPVLHLAAMVGTPTLGLYGPTDGRRRAPQGADHRIVQALPAGDARTGMLRIRVDDVLAGIETRLA